MNYAVTALNKLSLTGSSFDDGTTFSIPIAGLYNIYNALAAYSAAKFFGLSTEEIQERLSQKLNAYLVVETFTVEDKDIDVKQSKPSWI